MLHEPVAPLGGGAGIAGGGIGGGEAPPPPDPPGGKGLPEDKPVLPNESDEEEEADEENDPVLDAPAKIQASCCLVCVCGGGVHDALWSN